MEPRPVAVVIGDSRRLVEAIVRSLAGSHDVRVAGDAAAACPPGRPWTELDRVPAGVEILVHCADVYADGPLRETSAQAWRELYQANLFGFAELAHRLLPALRAARGHIIVVESARITDSPVNRAAYVGSRAALSVLTEALRDEEEGHGVRVTVIDPAEDPAAGAPIPDRAESIAGAVRSVTSLR
ncbi:hypothetical protein GCM10022380_87920 [Amycolatopsis tucumanensis]|uniref:Short-chain dehydrogenase n=2 Tax=Amycolatopsis tucumanensis TaxID=401106 RepID=A0ABP7JWU6_9PSEU